MDAFGSTPEILAQEVLTLAQTRGADGLPFFTTEEARRAYPNRQLFDTALDPKAVQRRRAKTIAQAFHDEARNFREQNGFTETDLSHPGVREAAFRVGRSSGWANGFWAGVVTVLAIVLVSAAALTLLR